MLKKSAIKFPLSLVMLCVAYLLFWPIAIDPPAFNPPVAPALKEVLEPGNSFLNLQTLTTGLGPEDVAFDLQGRMYTGLADGRIVRTNAESLEFEDWINTGGRPLGMEFNTEGDLIVADAIKGLLSINVRGEMTVLATEIDGIEFNFIDDLAIARNGVIYFVDASRDNKITDDYALKSFLDGRPLGQLLDYHPVEKKLNAFVTDCFFPMESH